MKSSRARSAIFAAAILIIAAAVAYFVTRPGSTVYQPRPAGTLTFNKDVAPIVFQNCSGCHRPGQAGPFSLLTYSDVRKRLEQIVEVTQARSMPPWLPEPGYGHFVNERRLNADALGILQQWAAEGGVEGKASDLPALPSWRDGWQLGTPDAVVTLSEPYTLRAEGPDLYRNFVLPLSWTERRFVRAVEFDPGNPAIVHHAFIRFDATRQSRRRDEMDAEPGFDGIHAPATAQPPEGYFLSWQPGKTPSSAPEDQSWPLEARSDVVLQLHLQSTGKPEKIQPWLAFYFASTPPKHNPLKLWLSSYQLDIPAAATNFLLEESYTLPADVSLLGILPHAHYLAREMEAYALRPDQTRVPLLRIKRWNFNWQGDYRYQKPVTLPKGSTVHMRYTYDNSTNNPANPNSPPRRVAYGLQSSDEMGELWLQVLPRTAADRAAISRDFQERVVQDTVAYNRYLLGQNPNDAKARSGLGKGYYFLGRTPEAFQLFHEAITLDPSYDEPYYYLGLIHRRQNKLPEAAQAFQLSVQLNPENPKALGNLGMVLLDLGNISAARQALQKAVALDPSDALALDSLGVACFQEGKLAEAETHFRKALQIAPTDAAAQQHLDAVLKTKK